MPKAKKTKARHRATSAETSRILAQVQRLCAERRLRLTAVRREVLLLLLRAPAPCKAYALLKRMAAHTAQPTAVYRALDFLLLHGFAHKIHSQNAYIACVHPQQAHGECHFLICRTCGGAQECCSHTTTHAIAQTARKNQFRNPSAVVEIFGECKLCTNR